MGSGEEGFALYPGYPRRATPRGEQEWNAHTLFFTRSGYAIQRCNAASHGMRNRLCIDIKCMLGASGRAPGMVKCQHPPLPLPRRLLSGGGNHKTCIKRPRGQCHCTATAKPQGRGPRVCKLSRHQAVAKIRISYNSK